MANSFYARGAQKVLDKTIDFDTDTLKAALVSNGYTVDLTLHEFLTDLGAYRVGTDQTLTGRTITNGAFDADDVTWTAVTAGSTVSRVVIYKDTGTLATSPLLLSLDTITNFPVSTNGGDITVQWDNGQYKIMSLF